MTKNIQSQNVLMLMYKYKVWLTEILHLGLLQQLCVPSATVDVSTIMKTDNIVVCVGMRVNFFW